MVYDGWVGSCKVRIFDWIDGKNIYMNMQYFAPGSSLERKPEKEISILVAKEDEEILENHLDSVVQHYDIWGGKYEHSV